jgi:NodT family efflux transporter outer membrane factor (OMF) lipoprotein
MSRRIGSFLLAPLLGVLCACEVGPDYMRPSSNVPMAYREDQGWMPASPQMAASYEAWWSIYNDPVLDGLEKQVDISNQNLRAAEAAFRAARADVGVQRGALFPVVTANGSARLAGTGTRNTDLFQATLGATWDADVWGRIRRTVEASVATAQANAADIAAARLSAQSELATDYFTLRASDEAAQLLMTIIEDFQMALTIAQNRYQAGVATLSDVLAAQTQIDGAQSQLVVQQLTRAKMEHAIAMLTGTSANEVKIELASLTTTVPVVPAGIPSTLLQRRPDIAASEFNVTAANAEIGVAIAAYYPDLTLAASGGLSASSLGSLFNASNTVWSVGPSLAETIFNGGAREAQTEAARARYDQSVANYRQTVLVAFQQVEDQLASLRILEEQGAVQDRTVEDARQSEMLALNQYRAGTADFTTVITAQATRLNAESVALNILNQRLAASVSLIIALGGGWDSSRIPDPDEVKRRTEMTSEAGRQP